VSYILTLSLGELGSPTHLDWRILFPLTEEEARIVQDSDITRRVVADLWTKQIAGAKEHDGPMQSGDSVDALQNAYEEALDLTQYLQKLLQERNV